MCPKWKGNNATAMVILKKAGPSQPSLPPIHSTPAPRFITLQGQTSATTEAKSRLRDPTSKGNPENVFLKHEYGQQRFNKDDTSVLNPYSPWNTHLLPETSPQGPPCGPP